MVLEKDLLQPLTNLAKELNKLPWSEPFNRVTKKFDNIETTFLIQRGQKSLEKFLTKRVGQLQQA